MSGERSDRRTRRHETARHEIVTAAWVLARREGLAGITMRDLGAGVGMTAQSIYSYFDSKHHIYDAMFQDGYLAFAEWMAVDDSERRPPASSAELVARVRADANRHVEFCVSDPERFQLLFLRTIPGFVPSEASYAIAVEVLGEMRARLSEVGVVGAAALDLWTAVMTGLASQQIANDPGGDRWSRLVDDAVVMLLAHTSTRSTTKRSP